MKNVKEGTRIRIENARRSLHDFNESEGVQNLKANVANTGKTIGEQTGKTYENIKPTLNHVGNSISTGLVQTKDVIAEKTAPVITKIGPTIQNTAKDLNEKSKPVRDNISNWSTTQFRRLSENFKGRTGGSTEA